jgi:hypothetical protein
MVASAPGLAGTATAMGVDGDKHTSWVHLAAVGVAAGLQVGIVECKQIP